MSIQRLVRRGWLVEQIQERRRYIRARAVKRREARKNPLAGVEVMFTRKVQAS